MIHGNVVQGVMSFPEMDAMMYKIEGEDLYLIGTSEHSMIGRFIDQIAADGAKLPLTLTSYSPCFRKEKGAHGIEERGVYRIHQFEKQEMIVVCKPEDSMAWYDKLWHNSVELFRSMEIPVRQLDCCSGDLADLKVKSCDIEAWSPRQQKYFEVCSCSNLGDAQARRLRIRYKDENGKTQFAHTLNNTCVAPPRMLIAFLENHLQADGTVTHPRGPAPLHGRQGPAGAQQEQVIPARFPAQTRRGVSLLREGTPRFLLFRGPTAGESRPPGRRLAGSGSSRPAVQRPTAVLPPHSPASQTFCISRPCGGDTALATCRKSCFLFCRVCPLTAFWNCVIVLSNRDVTRKGHSR